MHLYGSLFFSSAALHAVNVCIFVWLCINMCLRTVCMERPSVSLTLTPVFHAKVTLPPQWPHFMAQVGNEINSYSE